MASTVQKQVLVEQRYKTAGKTRTIIKFYNKTRVLTFLIKSSFPQNKPER